MEKQGNITFDIVVTKPDQVNAGRGRMGARNARFAIVLSLTLKGVTDEGLLAMRTQQERETLPYGQVCINLRLTGNIAHRKKAGEIDWHFAKAFGNTSHASGNAAFCGIIRKLVEGDQWVQQYCTHPKPPKPLEKEERAFLQRSASKGKAL